MTDTNNSRKRALNYHEFPKPGKLEIRATKPMANGRDLSLAYSPGVAEASLEIAKDPATANRYTARGNLVAVVTNGSAVLGLGNIGALASKPVMEGKAVLFKKFADIDCFDIELNQSDPEKLADIICAMEPSFGAINLEDIKAPDCFIVEQICRERMNIPVFHDDQHGTAIVLLAALMGAARITERRVTDMKIVIAGAGAGLAGALSANHTEFVSPALTHWTRSGDLMIVVILGGIGTLTGPVLGTFLFLLLEEFLPLLLHSVGLDLLSEHWRFVLGPILILIVLFAKTGLYGLIFRRDP